MKKIDVRFFTLAMVVGSGIWRGGGVWWGYEVRGTTYLVPPLEAEQLHEVRGTRYEQKMGGGVDVVTVGVRGTRYEVRRTPPLGTFHVPPVGPGHQWTLVSDWGRGGWGLGGWGQGVGGGRG